MYLRIYVYTDFIYMYMDIKKDQHKMYVFDIGLTQSKF